LSISWSGQAAKEEAVGEVKDEAAVEVKRETVGEVKGETEEAVKEESAHTQNDAEEEVKNEVEEEVKNEARVEAEVEAEETAAAHPMQEDTTATAVACPAVWMEEEQAVTVGSVKAEPLEDVATEGEVAVMEVDGSVTMEGEVATMEEEAATMEEVVPAVQPEENATMEEEAATMEGEAATMACEEVAVVISVKVEPEDNNGEPVVDVIDVDAIVEAEQMEVDQELEKGKVRRSPDRPWGGQVGGRPWRGQAGHVHLGAGPVIQTNRGVDEPENPPPGGHIFGLSLTRSAPLRPRVGLVVMSGRPC